MTNDEYQQLIEFLGRKFEEIDRRFETIDRRFESIDRRFDGIDAKLADHDHRFDAVEARLTEHDERFREVLKHFDHLYRRPERVEDEYHEILQPLRRIENLLAGEKGRCELLERACRN